VITGIRFGSLEPAPKPKQPTVDPRKVPTVQQQPANTKNKGKTNEPRRT